MARSAFKVTPLPWSQVNSISSVPSSWSSAEPGPRDLVQLIEALPVEEHQGPGVFEIEARLHVTERNLAMIFGLDDRHGGVEHIQVITVPDVGPDDPSGAD